MKLSLAITNGLFGFLLALPLIQRSVRILPPAHLYGAESVPKRPSFTWRDWLDGTYAPAQERRFAARLSVRPHLVRTDNQVAYSLFGRTGGRHGTKIVRGQGGWLYEKGYLDYHNREPTNDAKAALRAREARRLQDLLGARKIGFVVMLAPSKVTVYPEPLRPDALTRPAGAPENYDIARAALAAEGVNVLDARELFLRWKPDSEFPLFPRTGTHWSYAAVTRLSGEMYRNLERQTGVAYPEIVLAGLRTETTVLHEENDLGELLNLWTRRRVAGPQTHPEVVVRPAPGVPLPRLLFVGDSFAHTVNRLLDDHHAAERQDLLFYFKRRYIYPGGEDSPVDRKRINLRAELLASNAVILVINEAWLPDIGFGFLSAAVRALEAPGSDDAGDTDLP